MNEFYGCDFISMDKHSRKQSHNKGKGGGLSHGPMKRKIYQDCHVVDFNMGVNDGVESDRSGSMSLCDILSRHSFNNQER